jgi:uncharacterized protein YndB with AHSA1/START domain
VADSTPDREVAVTHVFDAPRDLVFKAWTDPDHVATWWGPDGFDTPRDKVDIDARVGGRYDLLMVQPDSGAEFPVRQEIIELVEPELIVLRHEAMPEIGMPNPITTRIELHEDAGGTRMTLTSSGYTDQMRENAATGWSQSFAKLEELLARGLG